MNEEDTPKKVEINWTYCPICGKAIPKVDDIKFCTKCGVDLQYVKEHMRLPERRDTIILQQASSPFYQKERYHQYYPERPRLTDEQLVNLKDAKLWGTFSTLGISFAAYIFMNIIAIILGVIVVVFTFNLDILFSPAFIIISSFTELSLILFPVLYVGRFIENPTFKNRLILLGFTVRGFNRRKILKEVLIGIGFAVLGLILVYSISIALEFLMYVIFGVEMVQGLMGGSEIDILIASSDYLGLILLIIVMIVVIGTSEEILFRGFLQKGLVRNLGKTRGVIITALIFSLIHLITVFLFPSSLLGFFISFTLNFFPYLAISLLLGLLYEWRKQNLVAVVITHGVYDALTVIIVFILYAFF